MSNNDQKVDFLMFSDKISNLQLISKKGVLDSELVVIIKEMFISEIKFSFSMNFTNINSFLSKNVFKYIKPFIEELGFKNLNVESILFSTDAYSKLNVFQPGSDFVNHMSGFYYTEMVSELIKSISGVGSLQVIENFQNDMMGAVRQKRKLIYDEKEVRNKLHDIV